MEAMEMKCYTIMMKNTWTEEFLRRVGKKRNILNTLRRRRGKLIGHVLRQFSLYKNSISCREKQPI
jgi:hypothetical protein